MTEILKKEVAERIAYTGALDTYEYNDVSGDCDIVNMTAEILDMIDRDPVALLEMLVSHIENLEG